MVCRRRSIIYSRDVVAFIPLAVFFFFRISLPLSLHHQYPLFLFSGTACLPLSQQAENPCVPPVFLSHRRHHHGLCLIVGLWLMVVSTRRFGRGHS